MGYNYNYSVSDECRYDDTLVAVFSGGSSTTGACTLTCNVADWDLYMRIRTSVDNAFEMFCEKVISDILKLKQEG